MVSQVKHSSVFIVVFVINRYILPLLPCVVNVFNPVISMVCWMWSWVGTQADHPVSGTVVDWSFVLYRRKTDEQYGGYTLLQNADFNANVLIKVWRKYWLSHESCFFAVPWKKRDTWLWWVLYTEVQLLRITFSWQSKIGLWSVTGLESIKSRQKHMLLSRSVKWMWSYEWEYL